MASDWLKENGVTLRAPEPEDLELMYAMENDTESWSVGNATLPYSRYTLKRYLETSCQDLFTERQARFVIETAEGAAGMIDLAEYDPLNNRAEVCIGLLGSFRNKGIATTAIHILCRYAKERLHIHQLYAYIPQWHQKSLDLFTKCGFTESARLKEWIRTEDGYSDVILVQKV